MNFILGKKIKMTQLFSEEGVVYPVTLVQAGPCYITQIKNREKDGYNSVQIGFVIKKKKLRGSEKTKPFRFLREFQTEDPNLKIGEEITVEVFKEGDVVDVSGRTKGKGFAGGVKRWGFVDKAKAHGAKDMRRIGSTGSRFPQRTPAGRKMPGRMGFVNKTIRNIKIVAVDKENNILALGGSLPGHYGSLLEIKKR